MNWQPIETAPRTSSDILLYEPFEPAICNGFWREDDGWVPSRGPEFWRQPTHWAPITLPSGAMRIT